MIRTLLVDDERIARAELQRMLAAHPSIEVIGEASNAAEALQQIGHLKPDAVFLDVEMPGDSGLVFARRLHDTRIVFCTAYSAFAAEAFEVEAVDYLLKPVTPEALARAVSRLDTSDRAVDARLTPDFAVLLKFGETSHIVRLRDIERFESVRNYVAIYCQYGTALITGTISRLEERLDRGHFLRASRGIILRIDAIRDLESDIDGGLVATMESGIKCVISRRQAQTLRARLSVL